MKFIILTGMSGAGKSTALKILEDMGFFCVDNLPISLMDKFASLAYENPEMQNVAMGIDIRNAGGKGDIDQVMNVMKNMTKNNISYEVLFLDADDKTLLKRYKETRRRHPLSAEGRVQTGIDKERMLIKPLKGMANYIIDTSHLLTRELNAEIKRIFLKTDDIKNLVLHIVSFGFKFGIPQDADLIFDVRFLPNPYYDENLRYLTGRDKKIKDYVMSDGDGEVFLDKLEDMISFLIPKYISEGKTQIILAIGCTGGKHRSVTMAEGFYERISARCKDSIGIKLEHRDIDDTTK